MVEYSRFSKAGVQVLEDGLGCGGVEGCAVLALELKAGCREAREGLESGDGVWEGRVCGSCAVDEGGGGKGGGAYYGGGGGGEGSYGE